MLLARCVGDGGVHALLAVAEQARRVIADEVDVGMTVRVGEGSGVAADERQRERRVMQDGASGPTGKHGTGTFVLRTRRGVAVGGVASHSLHHSHKGTLCGH